MQAGFPGLRGGKIVFAEYKPFPEGQQLLVSFPLLIQRYGNTVGR